MQVKGGRGGKLMQPPLLRTGNLQRILNFSSSIQIYVKNELAFLIFKTFLFVSDPDNPTALVVLVEEELVVIDLESPGWPTIPAQYLAPLHSSAITCSYHISNVTLKLWERIIIAGEQQNPQLSSAVRLQAVQITSIVLDAENAFFFFMHSESRIACLISYGS